MEFAYPSQAPRGWLLPGGNFLMMNGPHGDEDVEPCLQLFVGRIDTCSSCTGPREEEDVAPGTGTSGVVSLSWDIISAKPSSNSPSRKLTAFSHGTLSARVGAAYQLSKAYLVCQQQF